MKTEFGSEISSILSKIKKKSDIVKEWDLRLKDIAYSLLPQLKIIVEDDGHGMDLKTIHSKWLVPSTDNKQKNSTSKSGKRKVQGKKGIGRYAASILGNDFLMETTSKETNIKCIVVIDWREFENEKYEFLDEVPILVEAFQSESKGTKIEIITYDIWSNSEVEILIHNLKKLIPSKDSDSEDKFEIIFYLKDQNKDDKIKIKPYPTIDLYHYRISGKVYQEEGRIFASFDYENIYESTVEKTVIEKEIIEVPIENFCGEILFDIKAVDRDKLGLDFIKNTYESNLYNKKASEYTNPELLVILNELAGVGIIRENFSIRPYGDKDFDWIGLNKRRVNNPTMRLDSYQISGLITIESEDISGLEEKATREGLKENDKYDALIKIILSVISEMEQRRFIFRKYRINEEERPEEKIKKAFELTGLYTQIVNELNKAQVSLQVVNHVSKIIKKAESEKTKQVNSINQTLIEQEEKINEIIATYQIQATLGKVVNVVIHEAGKHLMYLRDQPKNVISFFNDLEKEINKKLVSQDNTITKNLIEKISSRLQEVKVQADLFIKLFNKLRTIAISKRNSKKQFDLIKAIRTSIDIYEEDIELYNIKLDFSAPMTITLNGWDFDIIAAFTNLIENSIYWLKIANKSDKIIEIYVEDFEDKVKIIYLDNGVGINENYIENQKIFEPGFTTKSNGTGLGLTITMEALQRNNGEINAMPNSNGAKFVVEIYKYN